MSHARERKIYKHITENVNGEVLPVEHDVNGPEKENVSFPAIKRSEKLNEHVQPCQETVWICGPR